MPAAMAPEDVTPARESPPPVAVTAPVTMGIDDPHLPNYAAFLAARELFLRRLAAPGSRTERLSGRG